ncbi:hypothetical protein CWI36_0242p0010 [Hamiltosporidium magnivora]|uniref:Uncharacterized protein n=1 Tax=Hamiltosporidium magnivora TaxID=148818 RepID=A0A4Q9LHQ5_9MICR|nr:hypothetical protein CWI36_0242p0010 [Hamiltosporidium magnivora]
MLKEHFISVIIFYLFAVIIKSGLTGLYFNSFGANILNIVFLMNIQTIDCAANPAPAQTKAPEEPTGQGTAQPPTKGSDLQKKDTTTEEEGTPETKKENDSSDKEPEEDKKKDGKEGVPPSGNKSAAQNGTNGGYSPPPTGNGNVFSGNGPVAKFMYDAAHGGNKKTKAYRGVLLVGGIILVIIIVVLICFLL